MADIGISFQLSASATQMASGINAGVVELQKLGYAVKKTSADISTLKAIELSRAFIDSVRAASTALLTFVDTPAKAAAALVDLSRRTGASASSLQSYQFAAEQSGVGIDSFAKAIQQLTINLGKAGVGDKEAIAAFESIGISVEKLSALTPDEQFLRIADAIASLPSPARQATAAIDIFGKTGRNLVSVFQEGPGYLRQMADEARRVGIVLQDSQLKELKALESSLSTVQSAFKALGARVAAELAPQLRAAADSVVNFIASIDSQTIQSVAQSAATALRQLAGVLELLVTVAAPAAKDILPTIGAYLAFINRQAIAGGIASLAKFFATATVAAFGYSTAAATSAAATTALAVSIRGLLVSTGIGALVVALGAVSGALVEYAVAGDDSSVVVKESLAEAQVEISKVQQATNEATEAVKEFGAAAEKAFKLPAEITDRTLLQGTVEEAAQAFQRFASEAGGLGNIPRELAAAFEMLQVDIDNANGGFLESDAAQKLIRQSAEQVLKIVGDVTKARKEEEDATKRVADAAAKATEEARKRTEELAAAGVSEAEKSRLQLQKDLLAIQQAVADAEKQLADARAANDSDAIRAAQERLNITRDTAKAAEATARDQAKQRNLEARGLSAELFKPARTLEDQLRALKDAVQANDITREQGNLGFNRLIERGLQIRKEISRELSKPAQRALEIQDVRTSAGISEYVRLATGREDPAVEQNRDQLKELKEIRTAIKNVFPLAIVDI